MLTLMLSSYLPEFPNYLYNMHNFDWSFITQSTVLKVDWLSVQKDKKVIHPINFTGKVSASQSSQEFFSDTQLYQVCDK